MKEEITDLERFMLLLIFALFIFIIAAVDKYFPSTNYNVALNVVPFMFLILYAWLKPKIVKKNRRKEK